jgi:hypothetical protein
VRRAYSGVVILAADRVLKANAHGRVTVAREFDNYKQAINRWPVLVDVLAPLEIRRDGSGTFLLMKRYDPVAEQSAVDHALRLYRMMQGCRSFADSQFDVSRSTQVAAGIDVLIDLYGSSIERLVRKRLQALRAGVDFDLGFAHGDFHSRNIVLDSAGTARLIDLDCARMNGVQQLDALYFVLEAEWSRSRTYWFEQIAAYLRSELPTDAQMVLNRFGVTVTSGLALVYLLDRIGQEAIHYGFQYLPGELAEAVMVLERSAA